MTAAAMVAGAVAVDAAVAIVAAGVWYCCPTALLMSSPLRLPLILPPLLFTCCCERCCCYCCVWRCCNDSLRHVAEGWLLINVSVVGWLLGVDCQNTVGRLLCLLLVLLLASVSGCAVGRPYGGVMVC